MKTKKSVIGLAIVAGLVFALAAGVQAANVSAKAGTLQKLIANNSVLSRHIQNGTIVAADLADGAVTTTKIADNSITSAKMVFDSVTGNYIAADAVGASEIAAGAVGTSEIADDSIAAADIAADAVGASEIAADAVGASEIAADAVGASEIAAGAVGTSEIAADTIVAADIAADAIGASELSSTAIEAGDIGAADLPSDGYAATYVNVGEANSITSAMITDLSIVDADIGVDVILAESIATGAVGTLEIADGTVTGGTAGTGVDIAANTITAANIATDGVATAEILNGTILGEDLASNIAITTSGTVRISGALNVTGAVLTGFTGADANSLIQNPDSAADNTITPAADVVGLTILAPATANILEVKNGVTNEIVVNNAGAATFTQAITATGGVSGALTGNVTGNLTGNVTGTVSGNAGTVTAGVYTTDTATVTGAMIAVDTIAAVDIAEGGVATSEILDSTIASADIAADTIAAVDIAEGGVATSEILDGTILAGDLASNSVTSSKILDGEITGGTAGSGVDIAANTITAANIATSGVATDEILDGTILAGDLAANIAISTTGSVATTGTGTITSAGLLTASNGLTLTTGTLTLPALSIADAALSANVSLLGSAIASSEITDDTIVNADINSAAAIAYSKLNLGTSIAATDLAANAVTSAKILDGTITGSDLATNIAISTTGATALNGGISADGTAFTVADTSGDVATAGDLAVNGDDINSDGTLDVTGATGMNLNTTAGDIVLDPAGNNVNPGTDSADSLGETGTRWATIFADTLNYSTALTDGGAAEVTTVTLGTSAADAVTINANTAITDDNWNVTNAGLANFVSVGAATPGTGTFTTLIGNTVQSNTTLSFVTSGESIVNSADTFTFTRNTSGAVTINAADDNSDADLTVDAGGTGDITLGSAGSNVTVADTLTVTTGGVIITAGGLDMTGDNITNVATIGDSNDAIQIGAAGTSTVAVDSANWDVSAGGAASGLTGVVSTGAVDFSGATSMVIPRGTSAPSAGDCDGASELGKLYLDTDDTDDGFFICTDEGGSIGWNAPALAD